MIILLNDEDVSPTKSWIYRGRYKVVFYRQTYTEVKSNENITTFKSIANIPGVEIYNTLGERNTKRGLIDVGVREQKIKVSKVESIEKIQRFMGQISGFQKQVKQLRDEKLEVERKYKVLEREFELLKTQQNLSTRMNTVDVNKFFNQKGSELDADRRKAFFQEIIKENVELRK